MKRTVKTLRSRRLPQAMAPVLRTLILSLSLILLSVLLLSSCSAAPSGQTGDPEADREAKISQAVEAVGSAVERFNALDSGRLQLHSELRTYIADSPDSTPRLSDAKKFVHTMDFIKNGREWDYLVHTEPAEEPPYGSLVTGGQLQRYAYYDGGEDDSSGWRPGARLGDAYGLDAAFRIYALPVTADSVKNALIEKDGQETRCTFTLKTNSDERSDEPADHAADLFRQTFWLDKNGLPVRLLIETEYGGGPEAGSGGSVRYEERYEYLLSEVNRSIKLNYFDQDSYVPPAEDLSVLETAYRLYDQVPARGIVDIAVPRLKGDGPGAKAISRQIEADFSRVTAAQPDYDELLISFTYPVFKIYFEEYRFGDVYELCVLGTSSSYYGSGSLRSVSRYYYDAKNDRSIEEQEFLKLRGLSEQAVLDRFYADSVESSDPTVYTYEDISNGYYIEEDGSLAFILNLYS